MYVEVFFIFEVYFIFEAFTAPFPEILDVFGEWGLLHVLTRDGKVLYLRRGLNKS